MVTYHPAQKQTAIINYCLVDSCRNMVLMPKKHFQHSISHVIGSEGKWKTRSCCLEMRDGRCGLPLERQALCNEGWLAPNLV